MLLYKNVLSNNNVEPGSLSKRLRDMIAAYEKVGSDIEKYKAKLKEAPADKKESIDQKIEDFKATQAEINQALVAGIEKWLKNKDTYAANAQRLAEGRAKKSASNASTQANTSEEKAQTGGSTATAAAPAPGAKTATATTTAGKQPAKTSAPVKKSNTAAWVLGIFALLAVVTAGSVYYYKNNKV